MTSLRSMLVPALVAGAVWGAGAARGSEIGVPAGRFPVRPSAAEGAARPVGALSARGAHLQGLPAGVTSDMVREGERLFAGLGLCSTCHGQDARGLQDLGGNLTDGEWRHSDGSYRAIVSTVEKGVPAERSTTGIPMPPRAGANLTDEQVRAVAAYVWTLSHGG